MPDWDEIVRRDGPAAWRSAYRLVGNRADADECLQEALLIALGIARREEVRHWRALLQRLASARALDRLRRRRRRGASEAVTDWDAIRGPAPSRAHHCFKLVNMILELWVPRARTRTRGTRRVGLNYRALGFREGETVTWFWIGSHADYDKLLARL